MFLNVQLKYTIYQKIVQYLTDPQTPLPASPLEPSDLPSQTASVSVQSFFHNAVDRHTDRETDGYRKWSVTIGCHHSIESNAA